MQKLWLVIALGLAAPIASADPPTTHEIIYNRPSGFWTSNRPAENGAYRYRLLGVGLVILLVTGLLVRRAIKKANDDRDARISQ
jgi:hypothetical protein